MRILLYIFFVTAVILAGYGFYIGQEDLATSQLFIGLGGNNLILCLDANFCLLPLERKGCKAIYAQPRKHLENA